MTRAPSHRPHTRRWTAGPDDTLTDLAAALLAARQHERRVAEAVAAGLEGAATLAACEYAVQASLHRYNAALQAEEDTP